MSALCNRFVQNAWKKELCSNCFKPREEHVGNEEASRFNVARASTNLKMENLKLQSILRGGKTSTDYHKKTVAFPDSLTEVIGYGGDDFLSDSDEDFEQMLEESLASDEDATGITTSTMPDSEEERALSNLTRANTNFNTITANLTDVLPSSELSKSTATSTANSARSFASLMLGRIQKDADGRKTTLLVSVTPFGGDESLPTARRPHDRKFTVNGSSIKCNKSIDAVADSKNEISSKNPKKIGEDRKKEITRQDLHSDASCKLEKIMDMPLIVPGNFVSGVQKNDPSDLRDMEKVQEDSSKGPTMESTRTEKKISRSPAIKKADNEKPKIAVQPSSMSLPLQNDDRTDCNGMEASTPAIRKQSGENEVPSANEDRSTILRGKDVNKITVHAAEERSFAGESPVEEERRVVGEASESKAVKATSMSSKPTTEFNFEESRELAGEPDGKADEEEITEPPALPRSPPPQLSIESRPLIQGETCGVRVSIVATEPRSSFLHGGLNGDVKAKPIVPQKPTMFTPKSIVASSKCEIGIALGASSKAINPGHVSSASPPPPPPPPPSVQNVVASSRSLQSTANTQDATNSTLLVTAKGKTAEGTQNSGTSYARSAEVNSATSEVKQDGVDQTSRSYASTPPNGVVEPSGVVKAACLAASHNKARAPMMTSQQAAVATRNHPTDGRDVSEGTDPEEECIDAQSSSGADSVRSPNKRRMAPRPPLPVEPVEDLSPGASLFARNPGANLKSDSPVVREKEKRERASSCSPKFRKAVCDAPDPTSGPRSNDAAGRRTISLSQDSLTNGQEVREGKKRGRSRFSLKRFLRMGSRKDVDMTTGHGSNSRLDEIPSTPQPKPRLEIIHPLELDGAAVEVLGNDRIVKIGEDQTDYCGGSRNEPAKSKSAAVGAQSHVAVRPGKPPPPPRNQSLEDWSRIPDSGNNKLARPPPPRVEVKQLTARSTEKTSSKTMSWQPASSTTTDSIYANLAAEDVTGEVRSALAPSKPQRTASMRDQAASQPLLKKQQGASTQNLSQNYESSVATTPPTSDSPTSNDSHVYECLSSSPECDSNLELRHDGMNGGGGATGGSHLPCKRKSDSGAMESSVEFKFHHQPFARSTSLPYCGSETESELYAPYAFYTGDEGPEEDQDWKNKDDELRLNRLRQRRGRSIVHRSLEDNYGAVVVANHEALAQFVEQLSQVPQVSASLRGLKNSNPRLSDFKIDVGTCVSIGRRIFCSATWNEQSVTLCIAFDLAMHVSRKEFYLAPIIEFIEIVPKVITETARLLGNKDGEATISVFPRLQVSTVQSFGSATKDASDDGTIRECSFVLLQFVNALKSLQARGIEEASRNLRNVVLCREDKDSCYRLYLLQGLNVDTCEERNEERVSLCQCALAALQQLYLTNRLPIVKELLLREKAVTLSQVKSLLEFSLWGPADVTLGEPRDREITLQRWLDLERATILHALVRTRAHLTITDEYQLLFLVRTSAKIMCEASILLDEQRKRLPKRAS